MKKVLAFNGSPRKTGNTSILLQKFIEGVNINSNYIETIYPAEIKLEYCRGCLRCNVLGRCAISGDDWAEISRKIEEADVLVLASPVYFHHISAPLKKLIDRFRSFIHVQITETGLIHTPRNTWNKDFVLLLSMGSPDPVEAQPVIELFRYMTSILGEKNNLHIITATRLAMVQQLLKSEEELSTMYEKMGIPVRLAAGDHEKNSKTLKACYSLGMKLTE